MCARLRRGDRGTLGEVIRQLVFVVAQVCIGFLPQKSTDAQHSDYRASERSHSGQAPHRTHAGKAMQAPGDSRTDLAEEISDQIGVALGRGEVQRGPLLLLPRIHVGAVRKQHFALHITAANGWRARAAKTGKYGLLADT